MDNEKYYSSSDLPLVSTLALTFPIVKLDRTDPRKIVFSFDNTKVLEKKIESYNNKKLKVEPQEFYNQIRSVKIMIYDRENSREKRTEQPKNPA